MRQLFGRPERAWLIAAVLACGLLAAALFLPLWKMELVAPQYPKGLTMYAYGNRFQDDPSSPYEDVREINGLNHYIGMKPIEEVTEMSLFVPGVLALIAGTVLVSFMAWMRKWLKALIVASFWFMPAFFVADLQYWLYNYGHTMNPDAALDTGAFTPRIWGTTKVWNFHSETSFQVGFYAMLLAAAVITFLPPAIRLVQRWRRGEEPTRERVTRTLLGRRGQGMVMKVLLLAALAPGAALFLVRDSTEASPAAQTDLLQDRIQRAAPGDTIFIDGGVYRERLIIDKAVSLIGRNWPVIDGGGQGDVVTITAADVSFSGFVVRGSGRSISQEPAAIKVNEVDRVTLRGNRVEDSHFGIYVLGSDGSTIAFNEVDPGGDTPVERRGHGIYLWEVSNTVVHENTVRNAADGIHLEFSEGNGIGANVVTKSRYGLHFMYANDNRMTGNTFRDNLAGAVLMFSHDLILKDNEFTGNRRGATGAGILLKDADNVFAEGNRLLRNKYGMTIEGTPQSKGATAVFLHNLLALNDTGLALMSNAPITFVENSMIDNTVQVKALGGELASRVMSSHSGMTHEPAASGGSQQPALPTGAVWTSNGRGNYWSDYRGYDADGDGVGDRPYLPEPPFAGQLERDETLRLFQFTPAQQALDMAADMFPLYRYKPVMEDGGPLMEPPEGPALPREGGFNRELLVASLLLIGAAYAGIAGVLGVDVGQAMRRGLSLAARTAGGTKPA